LFHDEQARERDPAKTVVERQEMIAADEQGEGDLVLVAQDSGRAAQTGRSVATALGLRVGLDTA
jgi:hypothetical protein